MEAVPEDSIHDVPESNENQMLPDWTTAASLLRSSDPVMARQEWEVVPN